MANVFFDGENKLITITLPPDINDDVIIDVQVDLYSDSKEWLLGTLVGQEAPDNAKYPPPLSAIGGEPTVGGNSVGITFFLINGWRIMPYGADHRLAVEGNLYEENGDSPYIAPITAGYQDITFTSPKSNFDATGLANDATVYHMQVAVDGGGNQDIFVTGSTAQTFIDLVAEINNDLTGATANMYEGMLRITSNTTGATSTISITDDTLVVALTDFDAIQSAVPGESGYNVVIESRVSNLVDQIQTEVAGGRAFGGMG